MRTMIVLLLAATVTAGCCKGCSGTGIDSNGLAIGLMLGASGRR
jgi:hypothetical protein